MNCLRCGREIADGASFCKSCEETVDQPLVESAYLNTQILLPVRRAQPAPAAQPKTVRRAERKPEEESKPRGRGAIAFLSVLCVLLLLAGLFVSMLFLNERSDAAALEERIAALEKENSKLQRALDFTDSHAAFVPNDGSNYYHTGDCIYFDKNSFMVYNVNTAKARGYEPCPYCHPAE